MGRIIPYLESEGTQLEHELQGEEDSEDDVENIKKLSVQFRLLIEFHGKTKGVDEDHDKDGILKDRRCHEGP